MLVAEFDREKAYERHGLVNTAQWLNWQCGIGPVAAREKVRVARALEQLPEISDAFEKGEISYSKVRGMTRVATAANESVLVSVARYGTAAHVEKLVRKFHWTQRRDAAKIAQQQHEFRNVSYFFDDGRHVHLARAVAAGDRRGGAQGARARRRSGAEPPNDVSAETSLQTPGTRAAPMRYGTSRRRISSIMGRRRERGSSADRVQVVVHIDQAILVGSVRSHGRGAPPLRARRRPRARARYGAAARLRLTVVGIVEGEDGEPLDIGRKSRSIPTAIARALKARDGGCRYPGCDRSRFTEGHHVKHWADGGETKLGNLVTLCDFHHTLVHEGGYGLRQTDDGLFVFTRPDGRRVEQNGSHCFRGNISGRTGFPGFEKRCALRAEPRGEARDHAETARCQWRGETMDYSHAIESMQFLDSKAPTPVLPATA